VILLERVIYHVPWHLRRQPCQSQSDIASGCLPMTPWSGSDQQPAIVSIV
jgi:hypothetical protein